MISRSNQSKNWRVKSGPENSSPEFDRHLHGKSGSQTNNDVVSVRTLRGDDDPRTLQAIEEGRRLYVGNMPYMAKVEDIEALFPKGDYLMYLVSLSLYDSYSRMLKGSS